MVYGNLQEELKAEFVKEAEDVFERLMSGEAQKLIDIEEEIGKLGLELKNSLLASKLKLEVKKKGLSLQNVQDVVKS